MARQPAVRNRAHPAAGPAGNARPSAGGRGSQERLRRPPGPYGRTIRRADEKSMSTLFYPEPLVAWAKLPRQSRRSAQRLVDLQMLRRSLPRHSRTPDEQDADLPGLAVRAELIPAMECSAHTLFFA